MAKCIEAVQVVACALLCSSVAEWNCMMYMHQFVIHSPVEGLFPVWAVMDRLAVNIYIQVFV